MSALPSAVRKQIKRANEIADAIMAERKASDEAAAQPTSPPAEGVTVEPPADAAPTASAENAQPVAAPVQEAAEAKPVQAVTSDWEQRYKVLQGKYNAEVPRLQRTTQDLTGQLNNLQQQLIHTQSLLAALGQNRSPATGDSNSTSGYAGKLIKDEEVKAFGADLIDVVRRVAREEIAPAMDPIKSVMDRVPQIEKQVSGVTARAVVNDRQKFLGYLSDNAPEWTRLNEDEQFLDWLDQTDPFSGRVRIDLLKHAEASHDGPRAVAFFKAYQKEHATVTPPAPTPSAAAGTPKKLEDFVAPGAPKSGAGGTPNEAGKRIYTKAEIGAFYDAVRRGFYRNKADEQRRIERDIFVAQTDGRVRP